MRTSAIALALVAAMCLASAAQATSCYDKCNMAQVSCNAECNKTGYKQSCYKACGETQMACVKKCDGSNSGNGQPSGGAGNPSNAGCLADCAKKADGKRKACTAAAKTCYDGCTATANTCFKKAKGHKSAIAKCTAAQTSCNAACTSTQNGCFAGATSYQNKCQAAC